MLVRRIRIICIYFLVMQVLKEYLNKSPWCAYEILQSPSSSQTCYFSSLFYIFRTAPSALHWSWSELLSTCPCKEGHLGLRDRNISRVASSHLTPLLSLHHCPPAIKLVLEVLNSAAHQPQSFPGHCHLLSLLFFPGAVWTGLVGFLLTPLPIPFWLWFW